MAFVGNSPPSFLRLQGCIDENTLVWGQGLFDWLPAKNIKLLLPMIRTPEGECKPLIILTLHTLTFTSGAGGKYGGLVRVMPSPSPGVRYNRHLPMIATVLIPPKYRVAMVVFLTP